MKTKRWLFLIMLVVTIGMIAACGSNDGDGGEQAEQPSGETGTSEPTQGGSVSIPIVADPTFNPWHPSAYAESNVINRVIFDGLTKFGKDGLPAPNLAENWEISDDGLVWTFNLRDDVNWHDGEPFTAEDVAFTFNEIVLDPDLGANNASHFSQLDRVEVIDDYTVDFHLASPVAALPAYLSFNTEIIPEHIFAGEDPWDLTSFNKENPVGTGPFKLKEYVSGQRVVLERNDDYFDQVAYLDEIEYKVLADANTHVAQLLSGELDIFALDDTSAIERIENADDITIVGRETPRFFWLILNHNHEEFQDKRLSQAMLHAIDRQAIIDTVLQGYGTIADAGIAPILSEYYTTDVKRYDFDQDKARELLAELGYEDSNGDGFVEKDGERLTITFDVGIQGDLESIAQMIQQYLIQVGIDVQLETMDWNSMIDKVVIQRDYEMTLNWWRYPADPDLTAYMHSNSADGNNIPAFSNEELDKLLEAGAQANSVEERQQIYLEAQQVMAEELPYMFLWYPQEVQVRQSSLQGIPDLAFGDALYYTNEWYIEQ
ncbi:ABC transporter substrate-binding protein [Amphibacillus sediminis]|uniref:ABC transporter substrate-binding protein n=1 Tax=Amphibacillus sediminis TaxID=360185 RepID=UPI00082D7123|nr:ABC transporter substrate-binding protein [Amphibacillus sediminis]